MTIYQNMNNENKQDKTSSNSAHAVAAHAISSSDEDPTQQNALATSFTNTSHLTNSTSPTWSSPDSHGRVTTKERVNSHDKNEVILLDGDNADDNDDDNNDCKMNGPNNVDDSFGKKRKRSDIDISNINIDLKQAAQPNKQIKKESPRESIGGNQQPGASKDCAISISSDGDLSIDDDMTSEQPPSRTKAPYVGNGKKLALQPQPVKGITVVAKKNRQAPSSTALSSQTSCTTKVAGPFAINESKAPQANAKDCSSSSREFDPKQVSLSLQYDPVGRAAHHPLDSKEQPQLVTNKSSLLNSSMDSTNHSPAVVQQAPAAAQSIASLPQAVGEATTPPPISTSAPNVVLENQLAVRREETSPLLQNYPDSIIINHDNAVSDQLDESLVNLASTTSAKVKHENEMSRHKLLLHTLQAKREDVMAAAEVNLPHQFVYEQRLKSTDTSYSSTESYCMPCNTVRWRGISQRKRIRARSISLAGIEPSLPFHKSPIMMSLNFHVPDKEELTHVPYIDDNDGVDRILAGAYDTSQRVKLLERGAISKQEIKNALLDGSLKEMVKQVGPGSFGDGVESSGLELHKADIVNSIALANDVCKEWVEERFKLLFEATSAAAETELSGVKSTPQESSKWEKDEQYLTEMESYRSLFCNRCLVYDCNLHGGEEDYCPPSLKWQYELARQRAADHAWKVCLKCMFALAHMFSPSLANSLVCF